MSKSITIIGLDVGTKRIGLAVGNSSMRIAIPFETIEVDGSEINVIAEMVVDQKAEVVVIGYPRNQSGEVTAQTKFIEEFSSRLSTVVPKIVFQDESLTSVMAEKRLADYKHPYSKGDIDAQAATIILQDYLESHYA